LRFLAETDNDLHNFNDAIVPPITINKFRVAQGYVHHSFDAYMPESCMPYAGDLIFPVSLKQGRHKFYLRISHNGSERS
jgi:hypothetical protein